MRCETVIVPVSGAYATRGMIKGQQVRGFLSYAHADGRLVRRFMNLLGPRLQVLGNLDLRVWSDTDLLVGQRWDDEIRNAIDAADFGLLLVSPALLTRDYIQRVEIPALLSAPGTVVMPVGLQRVDVVRSDLQGLEAHQIFLHRDEGGGEPKWFADLGGQNPARFCDALAAQIADRLTRRS